MRNHYSRKTIIFGVKLLNLLIGLLLGNLFASAQAPDFDWARQDQVYSFTNNEQGFRLAHDILDNSYVTGSFNDNAILSSGTFFESGSEVFIAEINAAILHTLTTAVMGNGTVSKKPDRASYPAGSSVQLIANPDPGYQFSGWSGDASGSKSPLTVLMDGNKNITATFIPIPKYNLNITISGSGTVTRNPKQASYLAGTSVELTATPAAGYQFSGWSGDASGTANPLPVTMDGNKNITATFIPRPNYILNITISGSGNVTRNPNKAPYPAGTSVQLTANPLPGYQFSGWSGDASGSENPKTVTMDGNKNITASFTPLKYTLNITETGDGHVIKSPQSPQGYLPGTSVELIAIAAQGWYFVGWSGNASGDANPLTVIMNGNKNITATFLQIPIYSLNITISGEGSVLKSPELYLYSPNSQVNLIVNPAPGYQFSHWSGNISGIGQILSSNIYYIVMHTNENITAHFIPLYTLNITNSAGGIVTKNPELPLGYQNGTIVQLTAIPDPGYLFIGWSGDASGATNPRTVFMNGNKNITATFIPLPSLNITISGNGTVVENPESPLGYLPGTPVQLIAIPDQGYQFSGWSGDASGTDNPLDIIMDGSKNITATFTPLTIYNLNVTISGNGTVTKSPDEPLYYFGQSVDLYPIPASGYQFSHWSGGASGTSDPLTVIMNGNKNITANFIPVLTERAMGINATSGQPIRQLASGEGTASDGKLPPVHDVKVYPNPFIDKIKIELTSETAAKTAKVIVTTIDGKTVYQKEVKLIKGRVLQELNGLSRLPPGIYFLMLQLDEKTIMKKVMKQ